MLCSSIILVQYEVFSDHAELQYISQIILFHIDGPMGDDAFDLNLCQPMFRVAVISGLAVCLPHDRSQS
jgi:hypothetical protein